MGSSTPNAGWSLLRVNRKRAQLGNNGTQTTWVDHVWENGDRSANRPPTDLGPITQGSRLASAHGQQVGTAS